MMPETGFGGLIDHLIPSMTDSITRYNIEKPYRLLSEIKVTKIKNGLHIFGCPPKEDRYADMLRLLVNIRSNNTPSLRECLLLTVNTLAAKLDAALDEPHEQNFIKKHINEDVKKFIDEGMSREQAFEMAGLRVFGWDATSGVPEAAHRGMWDASEEILNKLKNIFLSADGGLEGL